MLGFSYSSNIGCDSLDFNAVINNIQKYGSKIRVIVGIDTIYATQILNKTNDILTFLTRTVCCETSFVK